MKAHYSWSYTVSWSMYSSSNHSSTIIYIHSVPTVSRIHFVHRCMKASQMYKSALHEWKAGRSHKEEILAVGRGCRRCILLVGSIGNQRVQ